MEFKTRTTSQTTRQAPASQSSQSSGMSIKNERTRPKPFWLVGGILLIALLIAVFWYLKQTVFSAEGTIARDKYQAVFLTNGQVYFGHLSGLESEYSKLTDVFYLQTQPAAPQEEKPAEEAQPQVTLSKLGKNELHGPEDTMFIAKSQILFWENLKDDGKVVQAIKDSHKK